MTSLRFFVLLTLSFTWWAISLGADINCVTSDDAPVVTNVVKPTYPPLAAAKNINGVVLVDVQIDSCGIVRKASPVGGPSLLRKPAKEAAMRWRFNCRETSGGLRSARLTFIFRPISYVPKEGESDFTAPYQISVRWEGIAGSSQK